MSSISKFFAELQRRSVVRAAIVHVLAFWVLVQVADVVLPYVGIVDEPVRWAIMVGVGSFPATLIIAWFYEHPWTRFTRGRVASDIILIALVIAGASTWVMRNLPQVVHSRTSIVVMPFANSGTDVEESLSRALASEVNSLLMKSKSIDVIGFESAASPILRDLDAPAIAARLDVEHVLAGNIAMQGNSLRIDLRLLDRTGKALWDSAIDDSLENLFAIQEDIAVSIESLLGAGDEAVPVAEIAAQRCWMPNDPEALEKFYTARYYTELRTYTDDANQKLRQAIQFYKELIEDFPDFAEAHSGLAWAQAYQWSYDRENALPDWRERAVILSSRALELCPTLTEAMHLVPNQYDHENRWIGEHRQLTAFIEMEPQRSENRQRLSFHYRQTGHLDRALGVAKENYALNPLSVRTIKEYAHTLQAVGRIEESTDVFNVSIELGSTTDNFSARMVEAEQCGEDLECMLDQLPPPFVRHRDALREIWTLADNDATAPQAIEAAMTLLQQDPDLTNWFNIAACEQPHMAPLYFRVRDFSRTAGTYWHWANSWGEDCKHVWAHQDFPALMERAGFVEYWREVGWPPACRPDGDSYVCGQP